ncbi:protease modulator HflC [Methylicorpusculum oleiharenae]|uniref:protease modulator HflC n=1 Tax=Methylicorpusculum oleiharenae TaxID=1338687 RepID=UPI00135A685E|nr:protease modulator HflC [Methylicorpusculum oleiharenae]MCD2449516.1 protease modulator HflC [Methylicorpusculum oleiharenae]
MNPAQILVPISLSALLLSYMTVFYVGESEKAIKFRLGEIVESDYDPGLHFKLPLINNVSHYDARVQTLDAKSERFLTSEKKNVIVDSFVKWKISDVGLFYTTMGGDEYQANLRLDQVMKDAMRGEFGRRTIKELVSEDRGDMRRMLISRLAPVAKEYGIELLDIRIKRIDLPEEVSSSVYRRMEAERERVAREFRSQGSEQAEEISAQADKEREIILANAYRESEQIRGRGDAKSSEIYAASYGKNQEFYAFYRSLNAYATSFEKTQDTLVLEPKSDFFKYFSKEE